MTDGLTKLIARVDALADRYSKPHGLEKAFLLVAAVMSFGIISANPKADPQRLRAERAPEDWLAALAAEPTASEEGLRFLAEAAKRGYVTMAEAVTWADIERRLASTPRARLAAMGSFTPIPAGGKGVEALRARLAGMPKK